MTSPDGIFEAGLTQMKALFKQAIEKLDAADLADSDDWLDAYEGYEEEVRGAVKRATGEVLASIEAGKAALRPWQRSKRS